MVDFQTALTKETWKDDFARFMQQHPDAIASYQYLSHMFFDWRVGNKEIVDREQHNVLFYGLEQNLSETVPFDNGYFYDKTWENIDKIYKDKEIIRNAEKVFVMTENAGYCHISKKEMLGYVETMSFSEITVKGKIAYFK